MEIIFPYETMEQPLGVRFYHPRLDGVPIVPSPPIGEERILKLYEVPSKWQKLELDVEITTERQHVIDFERESGKFELVIVAHCRPTNSRQTFRPPRSEVDSTRWEGVLELDRDNFRDRVELRTILTSSRDDTPCRPVAFGDSWTVHLDEPASLRLRGTLPVKWVHFKASDAPALAQQFADSTHVVSLDGDLPAIWLNADFEGLEPLLKDRKDRRSSDKALHDMQRLSIARSVWMALVSDSMAAIPPIEGDEEPTFPETEWKAEVLRRLLPEIEPAQSERQLLRLAATEWRTHPGSATFLARAEAVVGEILKINESLRRFVQNYKQGDEA
jgi:hypothetical protein